MRKPKNRPKPTEIKSNRNRRISNYFGRFRLKVSQTENFRFGWPTLRKPTETEPTHPYFPLSFVVILSRGPFSINVDVFGFSQNCSYTVLALSFRSALGMPRTESFSAMSQGYLDFHCMFSVISLLGSGLGP